MKSIDEILKNYDSIKADRSENEIEMWLLSECEAEKKEVAPDTRRLVVLYNELGSFYRYHNRLQESKNAFLMAKELSEKMSFEDPPKQCCFDDSLLEEESSYVDIKMTSKGHANIEYATIINNLAGTYRLLKCYDEAKKLFKEAICIYEKDPKTPELLLCSAWNNLALVFLDQREYLNAIETLNKSWKLLQKLDYNYHEKATTCANLAIAYYNLKNQEQARQMLEYAENFYHLANMQNSLEYKDFLKMKKQMVL